MKKREDDMKFVVSEEFFNCVDDAVFGIVIVREFDNKGSNYEFEAKLRESCERAYEKFKDENIKESEHIKPYRDAFAKLNINPNKYRCSIEALMRRVAKGDVIPSINPIVDMGNAMSLKYILPVGIHDMDKFKGDIMIRRAMEGDEFVPFGSNEIQSPDEEEFVYVSENEVKTRKWTWRQGEKSKVTEESKNFFIPIDGFAHNSNDVLALRDEIATIFKNMNLYVKVGIIDRKNREFQID